MSDIAVFLEARNGRISKASLQALSEAKRLSAKSGGSVQAIIIGACDEVGLAGNHGATSVKHLTDDCLTSYSQDGYAAAIKNVAQGCGAILMAATAMGKDLAPRVAAKFDTGYAADVVEVGFDGGFTARRPVFAGKAFVSVKGSGDAPLVISLRPNVFAAEDSGNGVLATSVNAGITSVTAKVVEVLAASGGSLDVAEADVIVSGGRGLKGPENWKLIEDLAAVLGAATGASRAVVDAGWRPHSEQVGQTGKTVNPKLYIAVGISGAIQHLAGMRSSKCIVAINKDPQAPIFKVADYGIVGDAFEVVPKLTEHLKAALR